MSATTWGAHRNCPRVARNGSASASTGLSEAGAGPAGWRVGRHLVDGVLSGLAGPAFASLVQDEDRCGETREREQPEPADSQLCKERDTDDTRDETHEVAQ